MSDWHGLIRTRWNLPYVRVPGVVSEPFWGLLREQLSASRCQYYEHLVRPQDRGERR